MSRESALYQDVKFSAPLVIVSFGLAVWAFIKAAAAVDSVDLALFIVLGLVSCLVLLNFFAVMITIDPFSISRQYGFGLFGLEVDRREIEGAFIGRNNHISSWLFSPLLSKCVVAITNDGRKIHLPASQPHELLAILRR